MNNDKEVRRRIEICEDCEHKSKDKACGCKLFYPPCNLKIALRRGNCPIGKWENIDKKDDNGV